MMSYLCAFHQHLSVLFQIGRFLFTIWSELSHGRMESWDLEGMLGQSCSAIEVLVMKSMIEEDR